MSRPVLLLDVDGVLCPFPDDPDLPPEGCSRLDIPGWGGDLWVWASTPINERLERLSNTFEFIWATGWEERANEYLLDHYGIPAPLPVISFGANDLEGVPEDLRPHFGEVLQRTFRGMCWKLPWIAAWVAREQRPFAWVDDDIERGTIEWAEAQEIPALAIAIDPNVGLTDDHVETLEDWWSDVRTTDMGDSQPAQSQNSTDDRRRKG